MNSMAHKGFDATKLPRIVVNRPTFKDQSISMETVAVRFTKEQLDVIDGFAFGLKISRAAFLRNFFVHMLNLPVNGKCVDDDIYGTFNSAKGAPV